MIYVYVYGMAWFNQLPFSLDSAYCCTMSTWHTLLTEDSAPGRNWCGWSTAYWGKRGLRFTFQASCGSLWIWVWKRKIHPRDSKLWCVPAGEKFRAWWGNFVRLTYTTFKPGSHLLGSILLNLPDHVPWEDEPFPEASAYPNSKQGLWWKAIPDGHTNRPSLRLSSPLLPQDQRGNFKHAWQRFP